MQAGEQEPLVVLDVFEISKKQHEIFAMPFVEHRQGEMLLLIVKASVSDIHYLLLVNSYCKTGCKISDQCST